MDIQFLSFCLETIQQLESEGKTVPWGNSLFVMEAKTDTGAILDFEPFDIEPRDDIRTAYLKVNQTSVEMLKRTIPKILRKTLIPPLPNNRSIFPVDFRTKYTNTKFTKTPTIISLIV